MEDGKRESEEKWEEKKAARKGREGKKKKRLSPHVKHGLSYSVI